MSNLSKQFLPVWTFAKIGAKSALRDKVAIFFVFVFPLIFLFIFGGIFGRDDGSVSFDVALINKSDSEFARNFVESGKQDDAVLQIDESIQTREQADEKLERSEIDAIVILPENFGAVDKKLGYPTGQAKLIYSKDNEQGAQALGAVFDGIFKGINQEFTKAKDPFTVVMESTADESLSRFDYVFAGLLGFSVLSLGIFGPTNVFPKLKKQGVLRRYHTTTLKVWQYFMANVLSQAFIGVMSVALMVLAAIFAFDLQMRGNYLNLTILIALGIVVLFGIGLAIGGWAKNENQAAPLANLVTFPMMFLSGTFFPRFLMPDWLQSISGYLPLTPVIDGVRLIVTEGASLIDIAPQVGLLVGWGLVVYVVAFRVFRWE